MKRPIWRLAIISMTLGWLIFQLGSAHAQSTAADASHPLELNIKDPLMQSQLQDALSCAEFSPEDRSRNIALSVVDLSDSRNPRYAGHRDEHEMHGGSMPKIAILYGAIKLAEAGELDLDQKLPQAFRGKKLDTGEDLLTYFKRRMKPAKYATRLRNFLRGDWQWLNSELKSLIRSRLNGRSLNTENLRTALGKLSNDELIDQMNTEELLMMTIGPSSNWAATTLLNLVGHKRLAGFLQEARFNDPARGGGLWVGANYDNSNRRSATACPRASFGTQCATTLQMSRMVSMMVAGRDLAESGQAEGIRLFKDPKWDRRMSQIMGRTPKITHKFVYALYEIDPQYFTGTYGGNTAVTDEYESERKSGTLRRSSGADFNADSIVITGAEGKKYSVTFMAKGDHLGGKFTDVLKCLDQTVFEFAIQRRTVQISSAARARKSSLGAPRAVPCAEQDQALSFKAFERVNVKGKQFGAFKGGDFGVLKLLRNI